MPIDFKLASHAAWVAAGSPRRAGRLTPMTGPFLAGAAVVVVVVGGTVDVVAAGTAGFAAAFATCVPPGCAGLLLTRHRGGGASVRPLGPPRAAALTAFTDGPPADVDAWRRRPDGEDVALTG